MRVIASALILALVVLACRENKSRVPTPMSPTQVSSIEVTLAGVGITAQVPQRYTVLDQSARTGVENALLGDVSTVMAPNVYRRDKLVISLYKTGTPAPLSVDAGNLADVLRDVKEKYTAEHFGLDEATLRQIDGRDGILIRTERPTLVGGTFLAQEALVVTDKGVVSILSQIDLEFIPFDMQRSTFDSILNSIRFP